MSRQGSPEARYHAIPHALADENPEVIPSTIAVEADSDAADPPLVVVDTQIRWIHFILGCSVLLPWNVMITATPFFLSRLEGSPLKSTFSSYLSVSFTAFNFLFLAHATAVSKRTSPSRQIRICLSWLVGLNILLVLSTFLHITPGLFVAFVLFNGASQAALGGYLQTSTYAVASLFGPQVMQTMMAGQGAVAVAVSGVQVLSSSLFLWRATPETIPTRLVGSPEQDSARVFFALSAVFLIISAVAHNVLISTQAYKILVAPMEQKSLREQGTIEERPLLTSQGRNDSSSDNARILRVAKANILYEIAACYVFVVTLAVYPPITTSVKPTNPNTHPLLFNAIHFLLVNSGDFIGRAICSIPRLLVWSAKWLLTFSIGRTLFIPILLMCNIQRPQSEFPIPPAISSDILFMFILFAFGLSNGYVSTLCMMSASSLEHNPRLKHRKEDVDVAATLASFSIVGGLALGSCASFAVRAAICGCNPFTA